MAFALATVSAEPVEAACDGPYQFNVKELDAELYRRLFLSLQSELERFFNIEFSAFCLDEEEMGAYYDVQTNEVTIGIEFFIEQASPPGNINGAIAILAHEAAHSFQTRHGLLDMLKEQNPHRVKCIELHADFLAGGFMGWRSQSFDISEKNIAKIFFNLGDGDSLNDRHHHGLGAERYLSFLQGFRTQNVDEITLSSLGIAYVSQTNCDS
ncbi:hypothetical protein AVJ23_15880 [Pseudoponticoccus marisrubri]|uniref:Metalloprotease n=2 Tax=Pseudoponticoccus marisrubri TaxID=1685382 RepID=A0A0W7WGN7_9RHOB|nr:hypothetical protein AVJ23_15880 [Pseudoponticoccus marisrubri]